MLIAELISKNDRSHLPQAFNLFSLVAHSSIYSIIVNGQTKYFVGLNLDRLHIIPKISSSRKNSANPYNSAKSFLSQSEKSLAYQFPAKTLIISDTKKNLPSQNKKDNQSTKYCEIFMPHNIGIFWYKLWLPNSFLESDHIGHTKLHTLRLSRWHKDIEMLHWCHFFFERLAG